MYIFVDMKRGLFRLVGMLSLGLWVLGACNSKPEFPQSPQISHKSLTFRQGKPRPIFGSNLTEPTQDTLYIECTYKDGNGDLGLSPGDTLSPFNQRNSDGSINLNHFNYLPVVEFQNRTTGAWQVVDFGAGSTGFFGRFPRLKEDDAAQPLEGTIRYALTSFGLRNSSYAQIRIRLTIRDRALNTSNEVITPGIRTN